MSKRRRLLAVLAAVTFVFAVAAIVVARRHPSALGPLATYAFESGARVRFEGRVVQRLAAGSYTYLDVERSDGRRDWVVTLSSSKGAAASVERVSVTALGHADDFASARLHRTFDSLYFAVVRPS